MLSLNQICERIAIANPLTSGRALPIVYACQLPRAAIDYAPLPTPTIERDFDSGWEIVRQSKLAS